MRRLVEMRAILVVAALALAGTAVFALRPGSPAPPSPDVRSELYSLDLASGGTRRVARLRGQVSEPVFAADGRSLLFLLADGPGKARLMTLRPGGHARPLDGAGRWTLTSPGLAWSPDRTRIALAEAGRIVLASPDGTRRRVVASVRGGSLGNPSWSADGRTIAFAERRATGRGYLSAIWLVRAAGGRRRRVVNGSLPVGWLALSPDGQRVLFASQRGGEAILVDARTRRLRILARGARGFADFAWSPDGRLVAMQGPEGLAVLDVASGRRVAVVRRGDSPVFTPDGSRVVFVRLRAARD